jgi:GTP-binding protein
MNVDKAELVKMGTTGEHFPNDQLPEIMLSGRSNVGKSSFINSMTNRKKLAYTSTKPGKTQTLNFYNINDLMYFVDVPGYGYAKVSRKQREEFGTMIEGYIQSRKQLRLAVLLVDFRHTPTEDDCLMYDFLKYFHIPVMIIATKMDKVGTSTRKSHEKAIKKKLNFHEADFFIPYSSETFEGKDAAWQIISQYS